MVIEEKDIASLGDKLRAQGRRIAFTNGCFDILHAGHVRYLTKARAMGDCLIVGLNNDQSVKNLKGESRPINPESDRAEVLSALRAVDYVVLFGEPTAENLIHQVKPAVYVKGGDYTLKSLPETDAVYRYGGEIKFVSLVEGRSSTNVIQKIKSNV